MIMSLTLKHFIIFTNKNRNKSKISFKWLFEEILNLLDIWINEVSGWVIDEIKVLYINISNYEPLLGGSYIPLPKVLNNSMKGLINLKNKNHKCFMWCHVRLINLQIVTQKE